MSEQLSDNKDQQLDVDRNHKLKVALLSVLIIAIINILILQNLYQLQTVEESASDKQALMRAQINEQFSNTSSTEISPEARNEIMTQLKDSNVPINDEQRAIINKQLNGGEF
ncbi:MAG: hypothetical protein WC666_02895 [Candidatus Paceibacterota bacterium]|jgi:hypothetical protein